MPFPAPPAWRTLLVMVLTLASAMMSGAASAADYPATDVIAGGVDSPLLSRYEGSRMVGYWARPFDDTTLAAGPVPGKAGANGEFSKVLKLEGKVTRLAYHYPSERSSLEVMRNFRAAMQTAGMSVLYSCDKDECGGFAFGSRFLTGKVMDKSIIQMSPTYGSAYAPFNYGRGEPRYTLAKVQRPDGSTVHAAVYVVAPAQNYNGGIYLEVVESAAMETGKVDVNLNAQQMAKALATEGRVALYGIYFDTDKTVVRPDSQPALEEIAKLLQADPALKVYIVGHTDNQGSYAHNQELSQKRAESVLRDLVDQFKIPTQRLVAQGVASLAPVASNDTDAGRARNRRVELVKQ